MNKENYYVIVAGGRDFNNYKLMCEKLDFYLSDISKMYNIIIVSGTADGADRLGERYALERNYEVVKFPPNWNKYGKAAGPIRNKEMSEVASGCIVFWDKKSKGTRNMIETAREKNLEIKIVYYWFEDDKRIKHNKSIREL